MTNKLLWAGLDKEKGRLIINLLGLRISLPSKKAKIKKLEDLCGVMDARLQMAEYSAYHTTRGNVWLWGNMDKITEKEAVWFMSQKFYENAGYYPNLKNPKSFNEKLNWLKLHYKNPVESICIDKYKFKEYITKKLGAEYVVPLIGVYDSVDDIDFDKLPDKFVLKTNTAGSGMYGITIVRDKKDIDIDRIKYKFNNWLQEWNKVYYFCGSVGYKDIEPKIIAEEYLEQIDGQLYDYKFFCFHGEVKFIYVAIDHFPGQKSKISLFDLNWNKMPVSYDDHPNIDADIEKPQNFEKMLEICKILSKDFPFVRVDFYSVKDRVYVGEMTFTPGGAHGKYNPRSFDFEIGEYLDLNKLDKKYLKENYKKQEVNK